MTSQTSSIATRIAPTSAASGARVSRLSRSFHLEWRRCRVRSAAPAPGPPTVIPMESPSVLMLGPHSSCGLDDEMEQAADRDAPELRNVRMLTELGSTPVNFTHRHGYGHV